MAILRILICGGGIAGPALAYWLSRLGHDITIIERFPSLRAGGQQIDIRGQAVHVIKKMGLDTTIRSRVLDEAGFQFVDSSGNTKAFFGANKSGQGKQSFTSEFEIMRGDLCRIFHDAVKDKVKYVFGTSVESIEQADDGVTVRFSDGKEDRFDVLVDADGQGSRTRRMMLGSDAPDAFHSLGLYFAYFTIPQEEADTKLATLYHAPDNRGIWTRMDNPNTLQTYLCIMPQDDHVKNELQGALKEDAVRQKQVWAKQFHNVGWQSDRIINAMLNDPLADDFYCQQVGQVKAPIWSRDRVVLLGDAAYCPSPLTGMGTSAAIVGAYVLAGEIAKRHHGSNITEARDADDGILPALEEYDRRLRPFITKLQQLPPGVPRLVYPTTKWGIWLMHSVLGAVSTLRIDKLITSLSSDDVSGWDLHEYPELDRVPESSR